MATVLPPQSKSAKSKAARETQDLAKLPHVLLQFQEAGSDACTETLTVPGAVTNRQLELLLNRLLSRDEHTPYTFAIDTADGSVPVAHDLYSDVLKPQLKSTEDVWRVVYTPQALFHVKAVSRCSAAINGHVGVILAAQFSPASASRLATGSGDCTARIWDCDTQTPLYVLQGHTGWVLCVAYSPDAQIIATGSMDATLRLWDAASGQQLGNALTGHTKWITALAWEPLHRAACPPRLASASKDATVRIWDTMLRRIVLSLSGHAASVTCVRWGGRGRIYTGSQDKTIKVWSDSDGQLLHSLSAHAHWVNHLALSTDFALRTGAFDHSGEINTSKDAALARYNEAAKLLGGERLVSGSDDLVMYLWDIDKSTKPIARMHGHQKPINHMAFSPDGRYIASAAFDNHVKLWSALDGVFVTTLRGHVAPVYQCAWSADSRLLVSSSKDTTLKVWDIQKQKLLMDLPGHQDEVYAVDWSPDGQCVASGGKDRAVRLWRH